MAENESYYVAIDILCCHLGMSYDEACSELGINEQQKEKQQEQLNEQKSSINDMFEKE